MYLKHTDWLFSCYRECCYSRFLMFIWWFPDLPFWFLGAFASLKVSTLMSPSIRRRLTRAPQPQGPSTWSKTSASCCMSPLFANSETTRYFFAYSHINVLKFMCLLPYRFAQPVVNVTVLAWFLKTMLRLCLRLKMFFLHNFLNSVWQCVLIMYVLSCFIWTGICTQA